MRIETIIPRRGINDDNKGKKYALHKLISASSADYVWLQDDDIMPPVGSPSFLNCEEEEAPDLLILTLRMQSNNAHPSLLEQLQMAEYAAIQQLTIESAFHRHPVMCSGANMIVNRLRWMESYPDIHPEIASGDDMFLLESFKRRGLRISVSEDDALTATIRPIAQWSTLWKQRMRWAGKAAAYTDADIRRCGMLVVGMNILQVICPLILFVKFPVEWNLIHKREPQIGFWIILLLEIVYPWYILICLIGGLIRGTKQW